jgi:hypothetical protein
LPLAEEALPLARKTFGDHAFLTAQILNLVGGLRLELGKRDGVEGPLLEARKILQPSLLSGLGFLRSGSPPLALSDTFRELNRYYRKVDRPADAVAVALDRRRSWPNNAKQLYWSACDLAFCGPVVGRGKADLSEAELAKRSEYEKLALETLQMAIAKGFADTKSLRADAAWKGIRGRPEFDRIANELELKPKVERNEKR